MPKYGRSIKRLTKRKPKFKQSTLKRGNKAPGWNVNLMKKKRNPGVYVDPYRTKITSHTPVVPPNLKFRLQTFHLNLLNLTKDENILLRRPNGGVTNMKVPVIVCAAVYSKIRKMIRRCDWGGRISPNNRQIAAAEIVPLIPEGDGRPEEYGEEEATPENEIIEEPALVIDDSIIVIDDSSDEMIDVESIETNEYKAFPGDGESLTEYDVDVPDTSDEDEDDDDEDEDNNGYGDIDADDYEDSDNNDYDDGDGDDEETLEEESDYYEIIEEEYDPDLDESVEDSEEEVEESDEEEE